MKVTVFIQDETSKQFLSFPGTAGLSTFGSGSVKSKKVTWEQDGKTREMVMPINKQRATHIQRVVSLPYSYWAVSS